MPNRFLPHYVRKGYFTKHRKRIENGQVWTIGQRTIERVYEEHNVRIGNKVEIVECFGNGLLITVRSLSEGLTFDIQSQNLGRFVK